MGEAGPGITRARQLRHNQTGPERAMWSILWGFRNDGWHFRRQQPIGPYHADFACLHAGLIVEVDGETHVDEHRDFVRDDYMRSRGLHVLRFTNDDVLHHPDAVYTAIAGVLAAVASASNTPHPVPPPQGGRRPRTLAPAPGAETDGSASPSPLRGGDRGGGTPQPPNSDPATPHPVPPPQGGRRPRTPAPAPGAETAGPASPSPLRGGDRGGGTPLAPDSQLGTPPPPNAGPDPSP
jgi:very-short-patch-repair endonuclease